MEENKNNPNGSMRPTGSMQNPQGHTRPPQDQQRTVPNQPHNTQDRSHNPQNQSRPAQAQPRPNTETRLPDGAIVKPLKAQPGYQPRSTPARPSGAQNQPQPTGTVNPSDRTRPASGQLPPQRSAVVPPTQRPMQSPQSSQAPRAVSSSQSSQRPLPPPQSQSAPRSTQASRSHTQNPQNATHASNHGSSANPNRGQPSAQNRQPAPNRSDAVVSPAPNRKSYSSHHGDADSSQKLPVRRQPSSPQLEDPQSIKEWQKLQRAKQQRMYARESASSAVMSAVKAVVYIVCVIAVSIPLSIFVINTANDVFAFVKEEKLIEVTIPEYATIEDVAEILGEAGVIEYPWAFNLWSNLKERRNIEAGIYPEFIPGTYEVSTTLNYDYLRASFKKRTVRSTVNIMIPEGYTVDEIIDLFVSHGIGTREGFVDVINNYDFDYRFIDELTVTDDRLYRLEGYLFPDTYQFYTDSDEVTVINKLLHNFNIKFAAGYYDRCTDLGITVDEAIILASMIEKEARYASDFGYVSSVFHNRLKYKSSFPYLNSDATVMYAIAHDQGERLDTMTGTDLDYETPYNTYKYRGLPPGPIANPGLNAIKYALYPNDSKYFYFVSNSRGYMLYAETTEEHQKNIITARSQ